MVKGKSKYTGVGIHVFAGGFSMGVTRVMPVECQLECHGFGLESAEQVAKVRTVNCPPAQWPHVEAQFAYGNPRCTAFSPVTSGAHYESRDAHGPWAKQTCDVHDFAQYTAGRYDVAIWESVQQAYTVGKELLDYLTKEVYGPKGYRVAHVFVNAATFGNAQQRKRYFYVAYRDDRNFNITPPALKSQYYATAYDVLWKLRDRQTREHEANMSLDYDRDTYPKLTQDEKVTVPHLPNGWDLHAMAKYKFDSLPEKYRDTWLFRSSNMPFSMHAIFRINYMRPFPTIKSSSTRLIHPELDRPMTYGEFAAVMGWPDVPRGPNPVAQIAKGVCPDVGEWLAQQAVAYLDDEWGDEDWESTFNHHTGEWEGRDCEGAQEKVLDMTHYHGHDFDKDRYEIPEHVLYKYRHDVDRRSQRAG